MADKYFEEIEQQKRYDGVKAWHDSGITGKGIVVWNCENPEAEHGKITERRIRDSAPDATIITTSMELNSNNDGYTKHTVTYEGVTYDIEEFIKKFNIRILTASLHGSDSAGTKKGEYWNDLKKRYNLVIVTIAGNHSDSRIGGVFPPDVAMLLGACNFVKGKPKRAAYSSVGEILDFMQFTGIWSGTSFSAPYFAGMCALLLQSNPKLTQQEIFDYFVNNAEDLEEKGRDNNTGWGFAKMGKVENVKHKTQIELTIGSKKAYVDGNEVTLDCEPIISNNRTLVPIRFISEAIGCEVEWDSKAKKVTITN